MYLIIIISFYHIDTGYAVKGHTGKQKKTNEIDSEKIWVRNIYLQILSTEIISTFYI